MVKFAFGLALASMLSLASGSKTSGSRMQTYKASCHGRVRVTNLTFKQDFSAAIIVAHEKGSRPLFSEGAKARNAISMLAEEGLSGNVQNIATRERGFCGFAAPESKGLIFPGRHGRAKSSLTRTSARTPSTRWWPSSTTPTTPSWALLVPNSPRVVARPSTFPPPLMPVPRRTTRSVPACRAGHAPRAPGTPVNVTAETQRASSTCTEVSKALEISPKTTAGKIRWRLLWSPR
ncbi:unnamed protein product, partial [Ectocarpus sp. 6 AP-2014]